MCQMQSPFAVKFWLLCRIRFPLSYLISLKTPKCSRQLEHSSAKGMTLMSSPCLHVQLRFKQPWQRASHFHPTIFPCMWSFSSFFPYLPLFAVLWGESGLTAEGCIYWSLWPYNFASNIPVLLWAWNDYGAAIVSLLLAPPPFSPICITAMGWSSGNLGSRTRKSPAAFSLSLTVYLGHVFFFCVCTLEDKCRYIHAGIPGGICMNIHPCVSLHIIHMYLSGNV